MLNFTSIYYWEATKFAKSLIKTKESGFRPPNLAIFFLTKYTMIPVWVMWSVLTDLGLCLTDFFKKSALKWSSFCLKSLVFGLKVCSLRAMLAIFAVKYSVVRYMGSPLSI